MEIARGVVDAYDPTSHTAAVRLEGATGRLEDVPVLCVIPTDELAPGDSVVVAVWPDLGAVVLGSYTP